jgi:signal transduction histidine kinase
LVGSTRSAPPSPEALAAQISVRTRAGPLLEFSSVREPEVLRLALRLADERPAVASSIVIEKPLTELARDLRTTRRDIVLITFIFVATVAGLTWLLARRYVGRPLARLIENMRLVRGGNLKLSASQRRIDEVDAAQDEFDRLVGDLQVARDRADRELDARQNMERALQDADKLVTLGQLAAVMAHEVGSPLQVLEGRARALVRHPGDATVTKRTAEVLVEQSQRITRIVQQMLSMTRRRLPVRRQVDATSSVRSVFALLEVEARRKRVELVLERSGDSSVFADSDQLQQVLLNLVRNALQASPEGTAVVVLLREDGDCLAIEVRDQGLGVPESARPHLSEPFFTTRAGAGGTGLGLSVVKSIVSEHDGTLQFVHETKEGCLVRVVLPRVPPEGPAP